MMDHGLLRFLLTCIIANKAFNTVDLGAGFML